MTMHSQRLAKTKLDRIAAKTRNRKLAIRSLVRMLNKEFRGLKVHFVSQPHEDMKGSGYVSFMGFFNREYRVEDSDYLVVINRDPKLTHIKPRVHGFFNECYLTLTHEFRHAYQKRRRNYRQTRRACAKFKHFNRVVEDKVNYYIDYDELDAYAYEAALELQLRGYSLSDLKLLSTSRMMYDKYVKKYAPKHWKRWIKKVVKNFESMQKTNMSSRKKTLR